MFSFSVDEDETYVINNLIVHNCKVHSTNPVRLMISGVRKFCTVRGIKQRTDDLFDEYIRLLKAFKPKTFVARTSVA